MGKDTILDEERMAYKKQLADLMQSINPKPTIEDLERIKEMYALVKELQRHRGAVIGFTYTNWKGVTSKRIASISSVDFAECDWHEGKQFLLRALDQEKGAIRHFAVKDMKDVQFLY